MLGDFVVFCLALLRVNFAKFVENLLLAKAVAHQVGVQNTLGSL